MCNGNNICFEQFMSELDRYMEERVGFTTQELNSCDYYEYYTEGLSVEECASRAVIEAEGN